MLSFVNNLLTFTILHFSFQYRLFSQTFLQCKKTQTRICTGEDPLCVCSCYLSVEGLHVHIEFLLNVDLDFSPNCFLAGTRLIELELSYKKAYSALKRKTTSKERNLQGYYKVCNSPKISCISVFVKKNNTGTPNLWTKFNSLLAPNSPKSETSLPLKWFLHILPKTLMSPYVQRYVILVSQSLHLPERKV